MRSSERRGVLLERRVVDEDVESAQSADGSFDRLHAETRIGDVARDQDASTAFALDRALGGVGVLDAR